MDGDRAHAARRGRLEKHRLLADCAAVRGADRDHGAAGGEGHAGDRLRGGRAERSRRPPGGTVAGAGVGDDVPRRGLAGDHETVVSALDDAGGPARRGASKRREGSGRRRLTLGSLARGGPVRGRPTAGALETGALSTAWPEWGWVEGQV